MQTDPCATLTDPCFQASPYPEPSEPIVLRLGDDWGLAFAYSTGVSTTGAAGAPIDITAVTILGELYTPYVTTPLDLNAANSRTAKISPTDGTFAVGVEASVTATLTPDNPGQPVSMLRIMAGTSGLVRTIGVFPLMLVQGNAPPIGLPSALPVYVDPISQETVTLTGYSNAVPTPGI